MTIFKFTFFYTQHSLGMQDVFHGKGGRFCSKSAVKWLLKIPPHFAYVVTLPCETLMSENK